MTTTKRLTTTASPVYRWAAVIQHDDSANTYSMTMDLRVVRHCFVFQGTPASPPSRNEKGKREKKQRALWRVHGLNRQVLRLISSTSPTVRALMSNSTEGPANTCNAVLLQRFYDWLRLAPAFPCRTT